MQVETIRDLIQWMGHFHQSLGGHSEQGSSRVEDEREYLFLTELASKERSLSKAIKEFEAKGDPQALDCWCYEYLTDYDIIHSDMSENPFDDLDEDSVMDCVLGFNGQVVELLKDLNARISIPSVTALLNELIQFEEQHAKQMVQNLNRMSDI